MFCVYGRSRLLATKKIHKVMSNYFSEISKNLRKMQRKTQAEKQAFIDNLINIEFENMAPRKCTLEFSTPEILNEAYNLMKADPTNFGDLTLMRKIKKTTGITRSEKTGKPFLCWVALNG